MISYKSRNPYRNEEDTDIPTGGTPILGDDLTPEKTNSIFLYELINEQSVLKVRKKIDKKVIDYRKFLVENNLDVLTTEKSLHINLHINSYGGSASDAFNLHDYIKKSPIPIYTYVEGIAASAATLISVAGKRRYMTSNSLLMIHQLSSWFGGKYDEFNDEKANLDLYMDIIKKIYIENTKLKKAELNRLLKRDIYLPIEKCLEYGFVDETI